jgi:hypothetical protein
VETLIRSVSAFNQDDLDFYLSVPVSDLNLFKDSIKNNRVILISDEEILEKNPEIDKSKFKSLPGGLQQQIIKSEFWRLNVSFNYVCIDSDSEFIRPFRASDFLTSDGTPYTTMSEAHGLLDDALRMRKFEVIQNYFEIMQKVKDALKREGRIYAFGPTPVVWNRSVWESLELNYLAPKKLSIMDAICDIPFELCWYGEALLKYKSINLMPVESLFKVYHYKWQFQEDDLKNPKIKFLQQSYLGVVKQSNWYGHGVFFEKLFKYLKIKFK